MKRWDTNLPYYRRCIGYHTLRTGHTDVSYHPNTRTRLLYVRSVMLGFLAFSPSRAHGWRCGGFCLRQSSNASDITHVTMLRTRIVDVIVRNTRTMFAWKSTRVIAEWNSDN